MAYGPTAVLAYGAEQAPPLIGIGIERTTKWNFVNVYLRK